MKFKALGSCWLIVVNRCDYGCSEEHLGLRHDGDELSVLCFEPGLPDLRAPSAMDWRRRCNDGSPFPRTANEVRLAFNGRSALGVFRQIDHGCGGANRVRQCHHRATVKGVTDRAEIGTDKHPRDDAVLVGFDEGDPLQLRKGHLHRLDFFKWRHWPSLRVVVKDNYSRLDWPQ